MTSTLLCVPAAGDDPRRFTTEIQTAKAAFLDDPSYAVQIARAAVTIARKRKAWAERRAAA